MNNRESFSKDLSRLLELAQTKDNCLSIQEIKKCLSEIKLDASQWELVFGYLELNKITITDYKTNETTLAFLGKAQTETDKEENNEKQELSDFLSFYMQELAAIKTMTIEEEALLWSLLRIGDIDARRSLAEARLPLVVEVASLYSGRGISDEDLIQEGNMALLTALSDQELWLAAEKDMLLAECIQDALELALAEQSGEKHVAEFLAGQTTILLETINRLAEDMGRDATIEEIAEELHFTKEIVEDLMKVSLNAIHLAEAHGTAGNSK